MSSRQPRPQVARIASRLGERLDALSDELVDVIRSEIDFYRGGGVVTRAQLRASVRDNLRYMVGQLVTSEPANLDAPRRTGRERAEQDAPLPEVLRAYRLSFAFLWQRLLSEARELGVAARDELLDAATVVWEIADEYSIALTDAYRRRLSELLVAADRRRSVLVEMLVGGTVGDHRSAWEIAKLLEFPFEGTFLVVVVEMRTTGIGSGIDAEERLRGLRIASAWRANPDRDFGILSCGDDATARRAVDALRTELDIRIGVSPPFTRLDGSPRAARLGQVALESIPRGRGGLRQLDDTALSDLVTTSLNASRRLTHRVLRGVLILPDDERDTLLTTAQAWLDSNGSAAAAGKILYCHENTVRYRMRRLEEHLGRTLDAPHFLAEFTTAMLAIGIFPALGERLVESGTE